MNTEAPNLVVVSSNQTCLSLYLVLLSTVHLELKKIKSTLSHPSPFQVVFYAVNLGVDHTCFLIPFKYIFSLVSSNFTSLYSPHVTDKHCFSNAASLSRQKLKLGLSDILSSTHNPRDFNAFTHVYFLFCLPSPIC